MWPKIWQGNRDQIKTRHHSQRAEAENSDRWFIDGLGEKGRAQILGKKRVSSK